MVSSHVHPWLTSIVSHVHSIPFSIWPIRWYCRSTNPSSTRAGEAWRHNVVGLVDAMYPFDKYEQGKLARLTRPCNVWINSVRAFITAWYHLQFISIHIWYDIIWVRFLYLVLFIRWSQPQLSFRFQAQPQAYNRPGGFGEKKGENDVFPKVLNCCNLMSFVWICDVFWWLSPSRIAEILPQHEVPTQFSGVFVPLVNMCGSQLVSTPMATAKQVFLPSQHRSSTQGLVQVVFIVPHELKVNMMQCFEYVNLFACKVKVCHRIIIIQQLGCWFTYFCMNIDMLYTQKYLYISSIFLERLYGSWISLHSSHLVIFFPKASGSSPFWGTKGTDTVLCATARASALSGDTIAVDIPRFRKILGSVRFFPSQPRESDCECMMLYLIAIMKFLLFRLWVMLKIWCRNEKRRLVKAVFRV